MKRSRYSNGSLFFQSPGFIPYPWDPPAPRKGQPPLRPHDPVTGSVPSNSLEYVHDTISDGESVYEGHAFITSFKSILKFDVVPAENWNELEGFQQEIQKFYSTSTPYSPLWNSTGLWGPYQPKHPDMIEDDLLVIVKHKGEFYRGCIVCPIEETDSYYVEILDYGYVIRSSREDIYEMVQRFLRFPVQPIRCSLNLPYRYMYVQEWLEDQDVQKELNVGNILSKLLMVGMEEIQKLGLTNMLKIEYNWKNVRKCGEPWMVNLEMEKEGEKSVDLVTAICEKMEDAMRDAEC